jgi:hypothetical protein
LLRDKRHQFIHQARTADRRCQVAAV